MVKIGDFRRFSAFLAFSGQNIALLTTLLAETAKMVKIAKNGDFRHFCQRTRDSPLQKVSKTVKMAIFGDFRKNHYKTPRENHENRKIAIFAIFPL